MRNDPIKESEQQILNKVYEDAYKALAVISGQYDGIKLEFPISPNVAQIKKIVVSGSITTVYKAIAPVGTAAASAAWMIYKQVIDQTVAGTTDVTVTWADGNTNFDNVATNLPSLTYT